MKSLLFLLLLAAPAVAEIPYTLPGQATELSPEEFAKFAMIHNHLQYEQAAKNATSTPYTVARQGSLTTFGFRTLTTQSYVSERTYELNRFGGGPVWIINPYCPPRTFR